MVVFTVEVISAEQTSQTYLTPPSPPLAAAFLRMTPMSSSSVEDDRGDYEVSKDSESKRSSCGRARIEGIGTKQAIEEGDCEGVQ